VSQTSDKQETVSAVEPRFINELELSLNYDDAILKEIRILCLLSSVALFQALYSSNA
jgi:hypothetical protein